MQQWIRVSPCCAHMLQPLARASGTGRDGAYVSDELYVPGTGTSRFKHITPKFRQPRMPHAIATRRPHIWCHADRHDQWKRVT